MQDGETVKRSSLLGVVSPVSCVLSGFRKSLVFVLSTHIDCFGQRLLVELFRQKNLNYVALLTQGIVF